MNSIGQLRRRPGWRAGAVAAVVAAGIGSGLVSSAGAAAPGPAAVRAALVTRVAGATPPAADARPAAAIAAIVRRAMAAGHLRAVIVRVTEGHRVVANQAFGPSLTGQPATAAMHFRNGSVAFAYLGTLLMEYVDEHKVRLDDPVRRWLPRLPEAGRVTLRMLANQTTGYPDFEQDPAWQAAYAANPFRHWTYRQRINYAFARPLLFAPGKNWSYAHTNFMILGRILSMVGKKPLATLLRDQVPGAMGLTGTTSAPTAAIPGPVLHAYSSERKTPLHIPPATRFYEESTFWDVSWGTPAGASETTTIADLTRTAAALGTGSLLSRASYRAMTGPRLLGFGHAQANCQPECFKQTRYYNFGLGVVRTGAWLLQDPLLSGYSSAEAYLPSRKIAIAVAVTFAPGAFSAQGAVSNAADPLFRAIGADLAPGDAPPARKPAP